MRHHTNSSSLNRRREGEHTISVEAAISQTVERLFELLAQIEDIPRDSDEWRTVRQLVRCINMEVFPD